MPGGSGHKQTINMFSLGVPFQDVSPIKDILRSLQQNSPPSYIPTEMSILGKDKPNVFLFSGLSARMKKVTALPVWMLV